MLAPALLWHLPGSFFPFPTVCPVRRWQMVTCVLPETLPLSLLVPTGSSVLPCSYEHSQEHIVVVGKIKEVRLTALCVISTFCTSAGDQYQSGWRLLMDTIHPVFITDRIPYGPGQRTAASLVHQSSLQKSEESISSCCQTCFTADPV